KQVVSAATACIPFLENDDSNRALMGANMQRQAVPLMEPESPIVGTGMEYVNGKDSGAAIVCRNEGIVERIEAKIGHVRRVSTVDAEEMPGQPARYGRAGEIRSNRGSCYNHRPIVSEDARGTKGRILAGGASMENGDRALGQNVLLGVMPCRGYCDEYAIIM